MMNPNILNRTPLMFFDRAVNAQRSQLLTVMADAVSECRTAADQAAELNETGQVGLLRLAEVWSAIRAKEGMGGLVLKGTEAKILSDVVAQFYAYLSGCMFNDPVGMAIYAELYYIHDTDKGNPHCHIMLTMRPLDERGAWAAKSKKEYDLDENGEHIRLPSGRYKTHKVDLTGWNDKDNTLLWRKAWADYTNDFLERNGSPERIDHRSNAERGIDEIPTVHMGVAACQMEKKGIATEKGELNRNIQKANRLIREIRAQIGKLKEWIADLFKARETAPEQPPQSPNLANLLMKYLSVQREKSRKYSQRWQQQHTADELKTIAAAVNYLSEHGISNLDELDASLSSVSDKAYSIREGMKTAEQRMKELQKLMEYGRNYQTYKPIQDEYRQIRWKGKQEKFAEARRAELTLWDAANRYLHANLPKGTKTLPIAEWEQEYADLKTQRDSDYTKLKDTRAEVAELQKIRKCVDIALRADQPEQMQSRTKRHEQER